MLFNITFRLFVSYADAAVIGTVVFEASFNSMAFTSSAGVSVINMIVMSRIIRQHGSHGLCWCISHENGGHVMHQLLIWQSCDASVIKTVSCPVPVHQSSTWQSCDASVITMVVTSCAGDLLVVFLCWCISHQHGGHAPALMHQHSTCTWQAQADCLSY